MLPPAVGPTSDPPAPLPAPFNELDLGITPPARESFAAVGGSAVGPRLYLSDLAHLVAYLAGGAWPTNNRGRRRARGTLHHHSVGADLWRV